MIKRTNRKMTLEARIERLERLLAKNETVVKYAGDNGWGEPELTHKDFEPTDNVKQAFKSFASDANMMSNLCLSIGKAAYYNDKLAHLVGKALMRCTEDELKAILSTTRVHDDNYANDQIEEAGLYWKDYVL